MADEPLTKKRSFIGCYGNVNDFRWRFLLRILEICNLKYGFCQPVVGEKITRAIELAVAEKRGIKETTQQNLPTGFQTAEFMLEHGLIDASVPRSKLRERPACLLGHMLPQ